MLEAPCSPPCSQLLSSPAFQDDVRRLKDVIKYCVLAPPPAAAAAAASGGGAPTILRCKRRQGDRGGPPGITRQTIDLKDLTLADQPHRFSSEPAILGKGTYGIVKLMVHKKTGQRYAVKSLDKSIVTSTGTDHQVQLEIMAQQLVDHPNVVKCWGVKVDKTHIHLILDFCEKGDLFRRLRGAPNRRLDEEEVFRLFLQLVGALSHIHSLGLCHRDLKLENLLLDSHDTLKVADFGWVARINGYRKNKNFCGTLDYLAPEMITGSGHDWRTDIWAVGVLVYELLSGKPPFLSTSHYDLLQRILHTQLHQEPTVLLGGETEPKAVHRYIKPDALQCIKAFLQPDPDQRIKLKDITSLAWVQRMLKAVYSRLVHAELLTITVDQAAIISRASQDSSFLLLETPSERNSRFKPEILSCGLEEEEEEEEEEGPHNAYEPSLSSLRVSDKSLSPLCYAPTTTPDEPNVAHVSSVDDPPLGPMIPAASARVASLRTTPAERPPHSSNGGLIGAPTMVRSLSAFSRSPRRVKPPSAPTKQGTSLTLNRLLRASNAKTPPAAAAAAPVIRTVTATTAAVGPTMKMRSQTSLTSIGSTSKTPSPRKWHHPPTRSVHIRATSEISSPKSTANGKSSTSRRINPVKLAATRLMSTDASPHGDGGECTPGSPQQRRLSTGTARKPPLRSIPSTSRRGLTTSTNDPGALALAHQPRRRRRSGEIEALEGKRAAFVHPAGASNPTRNKSVTTFMSAAENIAPYPKTSAATTGTTRQQIQGKTLPLPMNSSMDNTTKPPEPSDPRGNVAFLPSTNLVVLRASRPTARNNPPLPPGGGGGVVKEALVRPDSIWSTSLNQFYGGREAGATWLNRNHHPDVYGGGGSSGARLGTQPLRPHQY